VGCCRGDGEGRVVVYMIFDFKTLLMKLCNLVKFKLWKLIRKSNSKSLFFGAGTGASKPAK